MPLNASTNTAAVYFIQTLFDLYWLHVKCTASLEQLSEQEHCHIVLARTMGFIWDEVEKIISHMNKNDSSNFPRIPQHA